ncbi:helix-turn-helix domain-containing protein [Brevundimonas staleyi]|uniref:Helix-turn-helix domain-containing protein n=1 Tax=Brevundimonas staleyi TaxID=74326 RepID=A0ABW0FU19_9CAUL
MTDDAQPDRLPHIAAHIGADYADSFAACRELMAPMFDLTAPSPEVAAAYTMDFALYDYGPIKLGMSLSSASIMVRDPGVIARTGADHFHVQFYRTHGFVMTIDGAEREVRPGDVGFMDLSRPVAIRTDGIDNLAAIIDRDLLLPLLAEPLDFHGAVLSRESEAGIAVREHLEEMWRLGADLTVAEGLDWSRTAAEVIVSAVRTSDQPPATRTEMRQAQFRALCRRIDRTLDDPELGPEILARQFFITRPTLYRMFEPHGGIGRYILRRRLTGVFRDLSDPTRAEQPIAAVFNRWGLDSHTAAGRAFRAAWGMTPSQCRSRALEHHRNGALSPSTFTIPPEMPASVKAYR